ncbi:MAG: hypothetical protein UX30_C0003G0070 [Candidatus Saccharibacteria bacterium GW2011_GWA2_46_10]|nr:MAG: hypothetical protein UX30_C0003G0070 [Candidatus Saccharibacteria bacterium GW2011_GWA2_46_10]OGL34370.1 MAG: hypothetical protein A3F05_02360 [Candidatus Saccharibacteria bacterium RIFCSPHIGHO2_12_FULL_47_17]
MIGQQKIQTKDPAVRIYKALANPTRLSLVRKLADKPRGEDGGELCAKSLLSQPTMSHHLAKLVEAGIVIESKYITRKSYILNRKLLAINGIDVNRL